jgi:GNAT superfamily N-acetyltransferase
MIITYRQGTLEDSFAVFQVFTESIIDLGERTNAMAITGGNDPEVLKSLWERRRSMFEFLARDCAHFWVAEKDGKIVAYARSIEHGGMLELTEFFVKPDQQSAGVGGKLLSRAFPKADEHHRAIIATLDERALHRYMKAGVYARFPIKYFYRKAEKVDVETDLKIKPMRQEIHLDAINHIDEQILGHMRRPIHTWLNGTRSGVVYKRDGEIVGYGYVGTGLGPFAVLDENDFPAVLAHAESLAAERGDEFGVETPLINQKAIHYFMEHKYRLDSFTVLFMSNEPFGRFENYLCFTPVFFM